MNHSQLVARAQHWLRYSRRHVVVLAEISHNTVSECPDVIGWKYGGHCSLIECKTSRSDFARDAKKSFRKANGMGAERWYATEPGLLKISDLPVRWGLIEIGVTKVRIVVHPAAFTPLERNHRGETNCLISAVQRVTDGWGRKVFGDISPLHGQLDPHPTVAANLKAYRDEIQSLRAKLRRRDEQITRLTPKMTDDERELSVALNGVGL